MTIETLLSQFFNPVEPMLQHPGQRGTHLIIPIDQDIDAAAEVAVVLSQWIRLDLTFAVVWFSVDDLGLVILTPTELLLHRLASATALT